MNIGIELTFVPDRKGDKEFPTLMAAKHAACALNRALKKTNRTARGYDTYFRAKADPFRRNDNGLFESWIVEVVNGDKPTTSLQWEDDGFVTLVQGIFDEARKLKLLPRIRRRGIHSPSGGGHLHIGINKLFNSDSVFLRRLSLFEKNLYVDFSNHPYIRWLFAEWWDENENSVVTYNEHQLKEFKPTDEDAYAHGRAEHAICARYSYTLKACYPTYEFRFFDAPTDAKMMALQVKFLTAWVRYHKVLVTEDKEILFTLRRSRFRSFKNENKAWRIVSKFLVRLGLNPQDYRSFFEENYLLRIRHGKLT